MSHIRTTSAGPGDASPVLCFAVRKFGRVSESWLWRQVTALRRLQPYVLTWQYVNREAFPLNGSPWREIEGRPWPERSTRLGVWRGRLARLGKRNFYAAVNPELANLQAVLADMNPAVLLAQSGPVALHLLPAARLLRIPMVAHFHGRDLSAALNDSGYRMSLRSSVGKFHHCVVVNQAQKDLLLEMGVEDQRVSVVPCGASVDEPANAAPVRTASRVRFIGVSRLVEKKGVDCTLRAFKQVVDRFPDCELMLVGDGPARSMLEKLTAELDIKDKVKFAGSIPNVKVRACLVSAHIFVQHSVVARDGNKEGSSVAVAEAAACGLPVITTLGSGGMEELVRHGETGFLVGQREVQEMAERMLELATDAELRGRFGRAARCHIMENFNVRRQVDKLEDVLLKYCKRDRVS